MLSNKDEKGDLNKMSRPTSKVIRESHKKIYDDIGFSIRKDSEYNKDYILKHISDYGYKSISDFVIQAIYNQIENDHTKK